MKRQKWQENELESAAITEESARPLTHPRAISQAARNPNGSHTAAAVQSGNSTRQSSPPGQPIATSSPVGMRFTGTIPKHRAGTSTNTYQSVQEDRSRTRQKCEYSGGRSTTARSVSRHSNNSYRSSTPHQPYRGHIEEGSAGPRDRLGNRMVHPPQHHNRRAGAGQRARPDGYNLRVDSHNRAW